MLVLSPGSNPTITIHVTQKNTYIHVMMVLQCLRFDLCLGYVFLPRISCDVHLVHTCPQLSKTYTTDSKMVFSNITSPGVIVTSMTVSASDELKGTPFEQPTLTLWDHDLANSSYPTLNWTTVEHRHCEVAEDVYVPADLYHNSCFFLRILSGDIRFKLRSWQSGIY
jgi:hypothetical protein